MKLAYAFLVVALMSGCGKINLKCGTLQDCGNGCTDVQTDKQNCGACGNACGNSQVCTAGLCTGCAVGTSVCAGNCVDLQTDSNNCGTCGTACDNGKTCSAGSCVCASPMVTCAGQCIDTQTSSSNCGGCGTVCTGGMTCQAGSCNCVAPQTACAGQCFSTVTDRVHCGMTCSVCAVGQVCNNGCAPAPAPAFATRPSDPTGWKDSANQDIAFTMVPTGIPGTIYECRTGPDAQFTASFPMWGNCDGATGTNPTHKPAPTAGTPEGSYRTEYRYRADSFTSPAIAHFFYTHNSLNNVATCPRNATDEPKFTDAQFFAAAQTFSTANPGLFPTSSLFGPPSNPPSLSDTTYLRNPFIKISFVGVQRSREMGVSPGLGSPWPAPGGNYVMNELSLRHRWVMNPTRTMILMKRSFLNDKKARPLDPPKNDCKNTFLFGGTAGDFIGPLAPRGAKRRIDCEALVVNVRGDGLCLGGPSSAPTPIQIDLNPGAAGTAQATTLSNVISSVTVNTSAAAFSVGSLGLHILIAGDPHWYTITAFVSATQVQVNSAIPAAHTAVAWKLASNGNFAPVFATPTGYAKFHTSPHAEAVGFRSPFKPSSNTKCTVPGCNTTNPALLFLPP